MRNCTSHHIEVSPGVKLYVRDWGHGRPIVLIHGWPFNHTQFEYQFMQFAKKHRCIGIDMRGSGKSDAPWGPYTYDMFADDIKVVVDHLNLKDIVIAGFSIGGAMVLRYLAKHNNHRVYKALFLSAAAPLFTKRPDFPYGFDKADVDKLIDQSYKDRPAMVAGFGDILFNKTSTPQYMQWIQHMSLTEAPNACVEKLITLRDADLRDDMAKVKVPVKILHGKKDKICPFDLGKTMHENIKGSQLVPFEESGHGAWHDELDKFNREFLSFVD